ncbi:hypothetical protein NDU88_001239 [Pleurodeles waltl]|uniref:Uncharacterized protein n=1 Tax=Pleurodeles waltl TaxID=8319 RepID=A0AAV7R8H0_PLEWA|nr:hypothetical protein NDU88_001239 [Pleurodeles waltl]
MKGDPPSGYRSGSRTILHTLELRSAGLMFGSPATGRPNRRSSRKVERMCSLMQMRWRRDEDPPPGILLVF